MVESFSLKGCRPLLKSLPDSYSCFYFNRVSFMINVVLWAGLGLVLVLQSMLRMNDF